MKAVAAAAEAREATAEETVGVAEWMVGVLVALALRAVEGAWAVYAAVMATTAEAGGVVAAQRTE